jgi:hypothetical protein
MALKRDKLFDLLGYFRYDKECNELLRNDDERPRISEKYWARVFLDAQGCKKVQEKFAKSIMQICLKDNSNRLKKIASFITVQVKALKYKRY